MAEKLHVYAARAGVADIGLVSDAYHIAMQPRLAALPDAFHHDMLHPARTALILMENAGCTDSRILAAGLVTETLAPEMRVPATVVAASLGTAVAALNAAVPDPSDNETLVEKLVTADDDVALIALAERLDHARHLHMRDPRLWPGYFAQTASVYAPVAERVCAELFRRYDRWMKAFERRLL